MGKFIHSTLLFCGFMLAGGFGVAGKVVNTPYQDPRVVFDFYFDDPRHIGSALFWLRSYMNPLMEAPYNLAPEFMDIVVVIHGTEIVTVAKANQKKYSQAVGRMQYYASLGVKFRVCGLAAADYGYRAKDFHDFVDIVPSAITELAHWQQQGYGLITPRILDKKFSIKEIR
jgi:intracellular sulfur oxidation DsrE/DsrF family protein